MRQDALRVSTAVDTGSCGHDFIVSVVTRDFLHGVLSFHLWYLLVSNPKNRSVVVVPSFLILLAKSHVELVIVARPLPADRFTFLDLDTSKIHFCDDLVFFCWWQRFMTGLFVDTHGAKVLLFIEAWRLEFPHELWHLRARWSWDGSPRAM